MNTITSKTTNVTVVSRTISASGAIIACINLDDNSTCSFSASQAVGDAVQEGQSYTIAETWSDYPTTDNTPA